MPELMATARSSPVATIGGSATRSGTAWRCMFEPISAVGVVVLQERDQARRNADHLLGRDVHELNLIDGDGDEVGLVPRGEDRALELAVLVDRRVGRRQVGFALLVGPHPEDGVGRLAALDLAVGGDQEAVLVHAAVDAQRADQSDVGPFRSFDRTDPAVVRDVDVADFEAGSFAVEPARAQSREPPLVSQLGQRVGLVDDLRQLAAAEEVLDGRADALGVDQRPRGHVLGVLQAHPLLDGAAELEETLAQLVGGQLVDGAQPAVAQVVDVIDVPLAAPQVEDVPDGVDVVFGRERHPVFGNILVELAVDPEPADLAQAVTVGIEELLMEQLAGLLQLRGVARPQPLVDPQQRAFVVGGRVFLERLQDQRVAGILQDLDHAQVAGVGQHLRRGLGNRRAAVDQDLAGIGIDDVAAGDPALELGGRLGSRPSRPPRPRKKPGAWPRRSNTGGSSLARASSTRTCPTGRSAPRAYLSW